MPLANPSYPPGPYRFVDREYMIIIYRTDIDALKRVVPEPLEVVEPIVKYEFIRMPDSTGFGDYTESGQVIPVRIRGEVGGYVHFMFLNDHPPVAGGRELWGFPKKLASPKLEVDRDTLVGTLDYGHVRIATGTMGFKHRELDHAAVHEVAQRTGLPLEDRPARRRLATGLRACSLPSQRHRAEGGVDGTSGARASSLRVGADRQFAGPGRDLGDALDRGSDARVG